MGEQFRLISFIPFDDGIAYFFLSWCGKPCLLIHNLLVKPQLIQKIIPHLKNDR